MSLLHTVHESLQGLQLQGASVGAAAVAAESALNQTESGLQYLWELKCVDWPDLFGTYAHFPWAMSVAYLVAIFWLRDEVMKTRDPIKPKTLLALWNLLLSGFSIMGFLRVAPRFYTLLADDGLKGSVCLPSETWCNGDAGWWTLLFILSKVPELIDTLFIVLGKGPLIFLHWYHHVTVLLYCWHAGFVRSANGIWFACMNLLVHSIMYFYYFLSAIGRKPSWDYYVTTLQILQMFVGVFVTGLTAFYHFTQPQECPHIDRDNTVLALLMYFSYLVLFLQFGINRYLRKRPAPELKPGQEKPVQNKPAQEKPVQNKPAQEKPVQNKPTQEKSVQNKPAQEKPAQEKPVQDKPAHSNPSPQKAAQTKPAQEKPAKEKPAAAKKPQKSGK